MHESRSERFWLCFAVALGVFGALIMTAGTIGMMVEPKEDCMGQIRIKNTRTGRTVKAKSGKDAALIAKIELDRRTGIELAAAAKGGASK